MNRRTILLASIFLFSVLGLTISQAQAVAPQRSIAIGKVNLAWVTDTPPSVLKPANGKISLSTMTFDGSDRVSANIYFYIPEDNLRVTIKLVSVISLDISAGTVIEGYWDVRVNGQLVLDDAWGECCADSSVCGLDVGGFGSNALVKIKGSITLYK
ncbi:MAG: hypothetical protein NWF13_08985 [Candidatus Bathyarchaeota archaeon]|nr:hypothetical protein [Candidatus Bathyarchaeota archaeon]